MKNMACLFMVSSAKFLSKNSENIRGALDAFVVSKVLVKAFSSSCRNKESLLFTVVPICGN